MQHLFLPIVNYSQEGNKTFPNWGVVDEDVDPTTLDFNPTEDYVEFEYLDGEE